MQHNVRINDLHDVLEQLNVKIVRICEIISRAVSCDCKKDLHCLRDNIERRLSKLEGRFDVSNAAKEYSIANVCMMQMKELQRIRRDLKSKFFEYISSITEKRNFYPFNDEVEHENVFRFKEKTISNISMDCLSGLTLLMKEFENASLYECFEDCKKMEVVNFPDDFSTDNIISMSGLFRNCSSLSSLDLSTFNTSSVTDMHYMFYGCSRLSSLDISTFNTSGVRDMSYMFYGCSSLSSLDLSTFNTRYFTDMYSMFSGCSSLKEVITKDEKIKNELRNGAIIKIPID